MLSRNDIRSEKNRNSTITTANNAMITLEQAKKAIDQLTAERITKETSEGKGYNRENYKEIQEEIIRKYIEIENPLVEGFVDDNNMPQESRLTETLINIMLKWGPIEKFRLDPNVDEIEINDYDCIFIEISGEKKLAYEPNGERVKFKDQDEYAQFINRLLREDGKFIDNTTVIVDAITRDGYRVAVQGDQANVMEKFGLRKGHRPITCTIRKQKDITFTSEALINNGTLANEMSDLISVIGYTKASSLIAGVTGAGKTVILQKSIDDLPKSYRIGGIGAPAETKMRKYNDKGEQINNAVHMEVKEYEGDNTPPLAFPVFDNLMRAMLRLTPDVAINEEMRSAIEFERGMALALTGHFYLSTLHAESSLGVVARYTTELMRIMGVSREVAIEQIAAFLKFIIVAKKFADKRRRISEITEVCGTEMVNGILQLKLNTIYRFIRRDEDEMSDTHTSRKISPKKLARSIIGSHYRVGCVSKEFQERMRESGFYWAQIKEFAEPLPTDENGNIIPIPCSYVFDPMIEEEDEDAAFD